MRSALGLAAMQPGADQTCTVPRKPSHGGAEGARWSEDAEFRPLRLDAFSLPLPAPPMDPHGVLGVARGASKEEVKKAYRKLCMEYHPDRRASVLAGEMHPTCQPSKSGSLIAGVPGCRHAMAPEHVQRQAASSFKAVTEAYEVLMDGAWWSLWLLFPCPLLHVCGRAGCPWQAVRPERAGLERRRKAPRDANPPPCPARRHAPLPALAGGRPRGRAPPPRAGRCRRRWGRELFLGVWQLLLERRLLRRQLLWLAAGPAHPALWWVVPGGAALSAAQLSALQQHRPASYRMGCSCCPATLQGPPPYLHTLSC